MNADNANLRLFCPDELASNRLDDVLETENRCFVGPILSIDDKLSPDGRVMEVLSEHLCEGWLEGYTLTGRHGLFATYEAFAMVAASMVVQHSKWLQEGIELPWREPVPSLNLLLTSSWTWASNDDDVEPDVILAAAGDVPTMETLAAAAWLRDRIPELKVRVVNVVDLMSLFPPDVHPHGMNSTQFVDLFTADKPVIFAFHGYQRAIHEIIHGRENAERFHVRGFTEQGTTTTPFDMVLMNDMSRYHLAIEALRRSSRVRPKATSLIADLQHRIAASRAYAREHLEDAPEIQHWVWPQA
jgi:phosphoketolase